MPDQLRSVNLDKKFDNAARKRIRGYLAKIVEDNMCSMQTWIDDAAARNPTEALKCFTVLMEFVIPKMQRVEHVDTDGNTLPTEIKIVLCRPEDTIIDG